MTHDYTKDPKSKRRASVPRDEFSLDHPPRGINMERTLEGGVAIRIRVFNPGYAGLYFLALLILCGVLCMPVMVNAKDTAALFKPGPVRVACATCGGCHAPDSPTWLGVAGLWLVLSLFIALGPFLAWELILHALGRHEIRFGMGAGSVFTGIGPLGRTRRFLLRSIKAVKVHELTIHDEDGNESTYYPHIRFELDNGKKISLLNLDPPLQAWLWFALKNLGFIPKPLNPETPVFTTPEPP